MPSHSRCALLALVCAVGTCQPLACAPSTYRGCYNDTHRAVSFLALALAPTLSLSSCAEACAADGFGVLAATGHGGAVPGAYCYCGRALNPAAARVDDALCSVPCPGDHASKCGGSGVSSVWSITCDGPLPAPAVGIDGAALPPGRACSQAGAKAWPFCDASLDVEARIADLVSRIAVSEIGPQLTARLAPAIPRLGMPPFMWGTNALHGITNYAPCRPSGVCASSWPSGVAMSAGWNTSALWQMGATTGREMRAYDNLMWSRVGATTVGGLTAWGPTINILRDGRWGRTQESIASEDPFAAAHFATAMTQGHQDGEDARYWLSAATLKHAFAYSLEDYTTPDGHWMRQTFNAVVSPFDLVDSYTPAFKAAISDGGAAGVMYAANELNGVPCAVDAAADALLDTWVAASGGAQPRAFYRATDGGQIINAVVGHHYVSTLDAAIGLAVAAESDIADGSEYYDDLTHAIMNGNATLTGARRLLANTLRVRFKLGLFDDAATQPYTRYGEADIANAAANASIALAARQSLVLLSNPGRMLPFPPPSGARTIAPLSSVAVIGPNADDMTVLGGNYMGAVCPNGPHGPVDDCHDSVLSAILRRAPDALFAQGSAVTTTSSSQLAAAVAAVKAAARVVLVLGLDQTLEREQLDRVNMTLPNAQRTLFAAVLEAAAGKPIAVILVHGGPVSIPELLSVQNVGVIDAFYPGVVAGADAIASAIYGEFSPGGRLPYSIPVPEWVTVSNFTSMAVATTTNASGAPGRTYRYVQPSLLLLPFGHGGSYTDFSLAWATTPPPTLFLSASDPARAVTLTVRITNGGAWSGGSADFVMQAYSSPVAGSFGALEPPFLPRAALFSFQRVAVAPNSAVDVAVTVSPADLELTASDGAGGFVKRVLEGEYSVRVGGDGGGGGLDVRIVIGA